MVRKVLRSARETLWHLESAVVDLMRHTTLLVPWMLQKRLFKLEFKKSRSELGYSEPSFESLMSINFNYLVSRASEINSSVIGKLAKSRDYDSADFNPEGKSESIGKDYNFEVLFLIPNGWLDSSSIQGKTQGVQIEFFIKGLKELGINVSLVEHGNLRKLGTLSENGNLILIVWSLSASDPSILQIPEITRLLKKDNPGNKIIGVITKEPGKGCMDSALRWKDIVDSVLYYEEASDFQRQLSKNFKVIHTPFIQSRRIDLSPKNISLEGVFWSGLMKFNRKNWLIALKILCKRFDIKVGVWIYFDSLIAISERFGYASVEELEKRMINYAFGLVLAHRNPGENALLIGSFWNVYMSGQIPIVQHEGEEPMLASYLTPQLDYFAIKSTEDLAAVLLFSKLYPSTVQMLRERILHRSLSNFSQKEIQKRLISQIVA